MKLTLILMFAVMPVFADMEKAQQEELAVPMELDSSTFDDDVESVSEKLRKFLWESQKDKCIREVNEANKNPAAAQSALSSLAKDYPELKEREPHVFDYFQGTIDFWRRDFEGSYGGFNAAVQKLLEKYPNGIPLGKHAAKNASFVSDLYMGRGTAAMFLGRNAEAVKDMNLAIHFSPTPRAHMQLNRGRALIRQKKYQEASEALDHAYGIDSKWTASASDRAKICVILAKRSLQPQVCRPAN